jgi:hypothetical protein
MEANGQGLESWDWIQLAQNRDQWQVVGNTIMDLTTLGLYPLGYASVSPGDLVQTCRVKGILPSAGGNKSGKDKGNTSQNN